MKSRIDLDKKCSFENMKAQKASREQRLLRKTTNFFLSFMRWDPSEYWKGECELEIDYKMIDKF